MSDSHYGPHIDGSIRRIGDSEYLRTDVSATLFLSDPSEYVGGELVIHDTYGQQRVKLPRSSLFVYPSGSLHEVTPVTQGERLAAYFFIQSLVPVTEHRRMLYELDQTIRSLRAELGETDSRSIQLTGHYHNLLRQWSLV